MEKKREKEKNRFTGQKRAAVLLLIGLGLLAGCGKKKP